MHRKDSEVNGPHLKECVICILKGDLGQRIVQNSRKQNWWNWVKAEKEHEAKKVNKECLYIPKWIIQENDKDVYILKTKSSLSTWIKFAISIQIPCKNVVDSFALCNMCVETPGYI